MGTGCLVACCVRVHGVSPRLLSERNRKAALPGLFDGVYSQDSGGVRQLGTTTLRPLLICAICQKYRERDLNRMQHYFFCSCFYRHQRHRRGARVFISRFVCGRTCSLRQHTCSSQSVCVTISALLRDFTGDFFRRVICASH